MSFRTEVDSVRAMISGLWDFDDEDAIVPLVRQQAAQLGTSALGLAAEFRSNWKIQPVTYGGDWNVRSYLDERAKTYEKERIARLEGNARLNAEIMATLPPADGTTNPESIDSVRDGGPV